MLMTSLFLLTDPKEKKLKFLEAKSKLAKISKMSKEMPVTNCCLNVSK